MNRFAFPHVIHKIQDIKIMANDDQLDFALRELMMEKKRRGSKIVR